MYPRPWLLLTLGSSVCRKVRTTLIPLWCLWCPFVFLNLSHLIRPLFADRCMRVSICRFGQHGSDNLYQVAEWYFFVNLDVESGRLFAEYCWAVLSVERYAMPSNRLLAECCCRYMDFSFDIEVLVVSLMDVCFMFVCLLLFISLFLFWIWISRSVGFLLSIVELCRKKV